MLPDFRHKKKAYFHSPEYRIISRLKKQAFSYIIFAKIYLLKHFIRNCQTIYCDSLYQILPGFTVRS